MLLLVHLNRNINEKSYNGKKYYLPKGIFNNYNVIISGENSFDHPIGSNIKRYKEVSKLATEQGEVYTTGSLLNCEYIENYYILIGANKTVDLSKEKGLDTYPKAI